MRVEVRMGPQGFLLVLAFLCRFFSAHQGTGPENCIISFHCPKSPLYR